MNTKCVSKGRARALGRRDPKYMRECERVEEVRQALRAARTQLDRLRAERRRVAAELGAAGAEHARHLRDEIGRREVEVERVRLELENAELELPNVPDPGVPDGTGPAENIVVATWGTPPNLPFTPRDHVELGERRKMLDLARGAKLAGHGFPLLYGPGAQLSRALVNLMLDLHTREHGYMEVEPPYVASRACFTGTGQLPKFEEQLYWTDGGTLGLVPTAEVPLTNLRREEILTEDELPLRLTAYTPCFRVEAGSYGRDVRGLIRVHQFAKVELVMITRPETSPEALEQLTGHAEHVLQVLGIPYRRVLLCAGDLGASAAKTYDIEAWFPSQQCYREVSSCSNCGEYQARRMSLRFRRRTGPIVYAHTLNGSGLAVGRTLAALLENFQRQDGTIAIPAALASYMG